MFSFLCEFIYLKLPPTPYMLHSAVCVYLIYFVFGSAESVYVSVKTLTLLLGLFLLLCDRVNIYIIFQMLGWVIVW